MPMNNEVARKARILMPTEATYLSSGYATYSKSLLSYLKDTGKFEVGELSSYGGPDDPRRKTIPWPNYPALPKMSDTNEVNLYQSNTINQFGQWKFEEACLAFRPDYVIDIRDPWYWTYEKYSPFRSLYNWCLIAPCDGENQHPSWIDDFASADGVFAYNDWSLATLAKEGGGLIKLQGAAPFGVELDLFKPVPCKREHKKRFGLDEDILIVGTVNRNQRRKLYPDLFEGFAKFLSEASPDVAKRTFLYVHLALIDLGYDIPRLIKRAGLASKVMMTYVCGDCMLAFPSFLHDVQRFCPRCGKPHAVTPSTQTGVDRKTMGAIINLFDVGVSWANSEGLGMAQLEYGAAGVPLISVDYSAMSDVVRKLKGYPVAPKALMMDPDNGVFRAIPDNDGLARTLVKLLELPESVRRKKSQEVRAATELHYTWQKTGAKWEKFFDDTNHRANWSRPAHYLNRVDKAPEGIGDADLVKWLLAAVLQRPDLIGSYLQLRLERDLMWGSATYNGGADIFSDMGAVSRPNRVPFNRDVLIGEFNKAVDKHNHYEKRRWEQWKK